MVLQGLIVAVIALTASNFLFAWRYYKLKRDIRNCFIRAAQVERDSTGRRLKERL